MQETARMNRYFTNFTWDFPFSSVWTVYKQSGASIKVSQHCGYVLLYPSSFTLQVRWLRLLTRITYWSKLIEIHSLATCLLREIYRVY
ncbi:hypothetical protein CUU56_09820 [Pectobacterium parvum]|nr:hypothetical protein [Pectobacterium parvum]